MRHRVAGRKLKRTASHRRALLRSLATSLIRHKKVRTTEAKAKAASRYVEPIISRAKRAYLAEQSGASPDVHARRVVARDIHDGAVVKELFTEVASKVAERPGGYTRVVKLGSRIGDGARMAVLELVDYNLDRDESAVRSRSKNVMDRAERVRRSREKQAQAKKEKAVAEAEVEAEAAAEEVVETAEEVTATAEEAVESTEEVVAEAAADESDTADEAVEDSASDDGEADATDDDETKKDS